MLNLEERIKSLVLLSGVIKDCYWLDTNTFVLYYNLANYELQKLFPAFISNHEYVQLYSEYQQDQHKIVYILEFEEDHIDVSDKIQSLYLDLLILNKAQEF